MQMEAGSRYVLEKDGIDVKSRMFKTVENPTETVEDFFVRLRFSRAIEIIFFSFYI